MSECFSRGLKGLPDILDAGLLSSRRFMLADDQGIAVLICEVLELKFVNLDLLVIVSV